jgi:hypothetical protein
MGSLVTNEQSGKAIMKIYRDGVEETIDETGIKVSKTRQGHVVETYYVSGVPKYFVTLAGTHYCAHGATVAEAITDAVWKDPSKRPSLEELKKTIQQEGHARKISLAEFRLLTGACKEGCRIAIERAKHDGSPMTAYDIRDKISKDWGGKLLQILEWPENRP